MSPQEAADWMVQEISKRKFLDQSTVAFKLFKIDKSLTYYNANGNLAIAKSVLDVFRRSMPEDIVWSRSSRHWRHRMPRDKLGRMQD